MVKQLSSALVTLCSLRIGWNRVRVRVQCPGPGHGHGHGHGRGRDPSLCLGRGHDRSCY